MTCAFATKPELAQQMIARAVEAGVPFSWVAGDEVYGGNPGLRSWLEDEGISYVMAVACSEMITVPGGTAARGRAGGPGARQPGGSGSAAPTGPRDRGCMTGR